MRKLKLKINDKEYTLELNRESIKWLEANGFVLADFDVKPVTFYDLLWQSLFLKNHPEVNPNLAIKLMKTYIDEKHNVADVIRFAIEEYSSFINALTDTNSEVRENLTIIEE